MRKEDILSSLFESITDRVMDLVGRVGNEPDFVVTGGIAKNVGMLDRIQERLGAVPMLKCEEPQIVGALGAALFARERSVTESRLT
jgi:activator of 2-hydroxyglutaryl-CoA dehydratase